MIPTTFQIQENTGVCCRNIWKIITHPKLNTKGDLAKLPYYGMDE